MLHNHYVASWSLTGADEALELRGEVYGETLDYVQKGTVIVAERCLAELWNGVLERDRSEIDRAMEVDKGLALDRALSNEALLMNELTHVMGAEDVYNLHIGPDDMSKYRTGMAYTFGQFVWELSWDTSEYACSDHPCPFRESPLQRWYEGGPLIPRGEVAAARYQEKLVKARRVEKEGA